MEPMALTAAGREEIIVSDRKRKDPDAQIFGPEGGLLQTVSVEGVIGIAAIADRVIYFSSRKSMASFDSIQSSVTMLSQ